MNGEHWVVAQNETRRLAATYAYAKDLCQYLNTGSFPNSNLWRSCARVSEQKLLKFKGLI